MYHFDAPSSCLVVALTAVKHRLLLRPRSAQPAGCQSFSFTLCTGAGDGTVKYWDMRMLSERGPAGAFEEPEAQAARRASKPVASIATATEGGRSHGVTCLSLSPQGAVSSFRLHTLLSEPQHP